jgi:DNA-binding LytR/AlgR family response regulator
MNDNLVLCDKEMVVTDSHQFFCLRYNQIIDITTNRPYVVITLLDKREIYVLSSLSKLMQNLPVTFFRCNQSSIVNLWYIKSCMRSGRSLIIHTALEKQFSVSPKYKNLFKDRLYFVKNVSIDEECVFCKKLLNHIPIGILSSDCTSK